MAAKIVQQSTRLGRISALTPARFRGWPPAIKVGLETVDVAESSVANQAPQREEVSIPAAILIHGEHHAALPRFLHEAARLRGRRRERFVHDHGPPRFD